MPYRGLPYFVAERVGGGRVDPYASERHEMPDRSHGVRYSAAPRSNSRRVVSYRASDAIRPPRAQGAGVDARPALADVEPMRILVAVMLMAVVAVAAAFVGIGVAHGFAGFVDGAVLTDDAPDRSSREAPLSTERASWKQGAVPHLYQIDPQWADRPYGSGTIGTDGAAPMALAMVRIDLTGDAATGPVEVAALAQREGFADQADPTSLLTDGAAVLGLTARPVEASEAGIRRQINAGFPVVCTVESPSFGGRACIVLTDIDVHGRLVVNDPASEDRSKRRWSFADITSASTSLWAYSVAR